MLRRFRRTRMHVDGRVSRSPADLSVIDAQVASVQLRRRWPSHKVWAAESFEIVQTVLDG